jgi:hypothetical protein
MVTIMYINQLKYIYDINKNVIAMNHASYFEMKL